MTLQVSSRTSEPSISSGRSCSERRRYLIAKTTRVKAIRSGEEDRDRDQEEEERVHLAGEVVACSGKSGKRGLHGLARPSASAAARPPSPAATSGR